VPTRSERINRAIHECIDYCREAGSVVPGLARFIAELRNSGEWKERDLRAVESSARHILYGIVDGATYPRDATNVPPDVSPTDPRSARAIEI
jgi:queuine/archaeosine tRNA-ribosyltransferase